MGQQQLILLVLATVIVGVAIVVGINAFSENSVKNNYDNILQRTTNIASEAQAWKQKPEVFGGQGQADGDDFAGVSFNDLGMAEGLATDGTAITYDCYADAHGVYHLNGTDGLLVVEGYGAASANYVELNVTGGRNEDIQLGNESARGNSDPKTLDCTNTFNANLSAE